MPALPSLRRSPAPVAALVGVLLLGGVTAAPGQEAALYGYVTDAAGAPLPQANVRVGPAVGTTTDDDGFYRLRGLPAGADTVTVSYVGYQTRRVAVTLPPGADRRLDVALPAAEIEAEGVTVRARARPQSLNTHRLRAAEVRRLSAPLGGDLFRSLSLLPGVSRTSDYSSRLYVRGSGHGQTLVVLDGTTLYNPTHFLGFYSTFNPSAVESVQLHKGPYSAEHGGRLGSVLDVRTRRGTRRAVSGGLRLGLTDSGGHVEGPIGRDPWGSYMVAVRRSTSELLLRGLQATDREWIPDDGAFYDVNARLDADLGPDDRLSLSLYAGRDGMELRNDGLTIDTHHRNQAVSATWTRRVGPRLSSSLSVGGSHYRNEPMVKNEAGRFYRRFEEVNELGELSLAATAQYTPSSRHTVDAGVRGTGMRFVLRNRERLASRGETEEADGWDRGTVGGSTAVYVQDTYRPTRTWTLRGGLRGTYYRPGGFWRLAPRLTVRHALTRSVRLQAAYGRTYQFRSVDADPRFSGFDTWVVADQGVPPSASDQFSVGTTVQVAQHWRVEATGYFRVMEDLFELRPGLGFPPRGSYADRFRVGNGRAYGGEFSLRREDGTVTGQLNYTIGRTERLFSSPRSVPGPTFYPAHHDRPHQLSASARWRLSDAWALTGRFNAKTGRPYTPDRIDPLFDEPFPNEPERVPPPQATNQKRLPTYHRLDLGVRRTGRLFGWGTYRLRVTVANVYARENVWFYRFRAADGERVRSDVSQIPVPVPYVTLSVHF
jgi:outer membrane cobalamin receptor